MSFFLNYWFLLLLLMSFCVFRHLERRHRDRIERLLDLQEEASRSTSATPAQSPRFTVAYASESWYRRIWKRYPSEGAGLLVIEPDEWIFSGHLDSLEPVRLSFPRSHVWIRAEGETWWPSGPVYWLSIEDKNTRHYFAAVSESMATPSKKKNSALVKLLRDEQRCG